MGYNADDHQYLQFYQFNFDTVLSSSSLIIQNVVIRSGVKIEFLKLYMLLPQYTYQTFTLEPLCFVARR